MLDANEFPSEFKFTTWTFSLNGLARSLCQLFDLLSIKGIPLIADDRFRTFDHLN
jgi:hypothetical protein